MSAWQHSEDALRGGCCFTGGAHGAQICVQARLDLILLARAAAVRAGVGPLRAAPLISSRPCQLRAPMVGHLCRRASELVFPLPLLSRGAQGCGASGPLGMQHAGRFGSTAGGLHADLIHVDICASCMHATLSCGLAMLSGERLRVISAYAASQHPACV